MKRANGLYKEFYGDPYPWVRPVVTASLLGAFGLLIIGTYYIGAFLYEVLVCR